MVPAKLEDSLHRRMERLVVEMCSRGIRLPQAMREFERHYLEAALSRSGGSRTGAARALGIHRNTLTNKLQGHRL